MSTSKTDLENAYDLSSPEDAKHLYADWAQTYDRQFAGDHGYDLPDHTAAAFAHHGGEGPILDVGAGTGLCGVALAKRDLGPVDATDISPEMLAKALRKDVYRDLIEADVTEGIPVPAGTYAGVVSSGTFTHGHLGPEILPALLRVGRTGALYALSINAKFFHRADFRGSFDRLLQGNWIKDLRLPEVRIYHETTEGTSTEHSQDTAFIALFRKT